MEGIVRDRRRIVLAGAVAIAAAVAVFVAMSGDKPVAVAPNAPLSDAPPPAQTPSPPAAQPPSSAAEAPVVEDAAPAQAVLSLACPEITGGDLPQRLTEKCFAALEAHFTVRPASSTILPVRPELTWGAVFGGVADDIEAVDAALEDEACAVPEGEIRPELASRCAARAMAELHLLRDVCAEGRPWRTDVRFSLSRPGFDLPSLNLAGWSRMERTSYRANINGALRERELARWAGEAPHQAAYLDGKNRLDALHFRTAWKQARCFGSRGLLTWMRGKRWEGLLGRAARLGDAFALAHHVGSARHGSELARRDPALSLLHSASVELQGVRRAWQREDPPDPDPRRFFEERSEDFKRLFDLADVDCGDPCTAASMMAVIDEYVARYADCVERKCRNLAKMTELHNAMKRHVARYADALVRQRRATAPARSLPQRKRAEAAAIKYALAVESLARANGTRVNKRLLRRMADPENPELLNDEEVEHARYAATLLVEKLSAQRE